MYYSRKFGSSSNDGDEEARKARSEILYGLELKNKEEKILDVEDIQGDSILGFNQPYNKQILLNLKNDHPATIAGAKEWLLSISHKLTTTMALLEHRKKRRKGIPTPVGFCNLAFSHGCLQSLLKGTVNEKSMQSFASGSAFTIGAYNRAYLLGEDGADWKFGKIRNNDVLLNISADTKEVLDKMTADFVTPSCLNWFEEMKSVTSFRGVKGTSLYGHEHFGFLDGLSQPEVRGKYLVKDIKESNDRRLTITDSSSFDQCPSPPSDGNKYEFIVRRRLLASDIDQRYKNYSKPGFRLLDPGHFLLGYLENFPDTQDGEMQNPNPDSYRNLLAPYPEWCKNGSFVVFRNIKQDVPNFWSFMYKCAENLITQENLKPDDEEAKRKLAGDIAAQVMGRWWDGTPLIFGTPISEQHYPPENVELPMKKGKDGVLNGFQFDSEEHAWRVLGDDGKIKEVRPPDKNDQKVCTFKSDKAGLACPYGSHIRKVNPRDEFTDVGSNVQTNKHRIIRRGNNFFDGHHPMNPTTAYDRVKNVFDPTDQEKKENRGLALLMYQADIEEQFEFLQRHWANSSTRPRADGDDFVIGQKPPEKPKRSLMISQIGGKPLTKPFFVKQSVKKDFTSSEGMGYFLLPAVSAIINVLCAPALTVALEPAQVLDYDTPANVRDFRLSSSYVKWNWTVNYLYWSNLWDGNNYTSKSAQTVLPEYVDMTGCGIANRLPNPLQLAKDYAFDFSKVTDPVSNPPPRTTLQFRSTADLVAMAKLAKTTPITKIVSWTAFPKRLRDLFDNSDVNPYEYVEELGWPSKDVTYRNYSLTPTARQMDEYCEWFTHRDNNGRITRIDITCESPEYWTFLFKNEPDTAVALYQEFIDPKVKLEDLTDNQGNYNIYNKWNTTQGAMHLNCPPNSLFAEIFIAAEASTLWQNVNTGKNGIPVQAATAGGDIITSAKYGLPTRASDPTIGATINGLIQQGLIVTVANPVGLYLEDLDTTGWMKPTKRPFSAHEIKRIVSYQRPGKIEDEKENKRNMHLRIKIEVPQDMGFTLGECFLGGVPIDWAGQLIDASVTVFLAGQAIVGNPTTASGQPAAVQYLKEGPMPILAPKDDWNGKDIGPPARFNPYVQPPEPPYNIAPPN